MNISFHIGEANTILISAIKTQANLESVQSLINKSGLMYTNMNVHSWDDAGSDVFSVTLMLPVTVEGKPYANFDNLVREKAYQQFKVDMISVFSIPEKQFLTLDEAEATEARNKQPNRHRFVSVERCSHLPVIEPNEDESTSPRPF